MSEYGTYYGYHPAIQEVIKRQNELFKGENVKKLRHFSVRSIPEGVEILLYAKSKELKLEIRFYEQDGVMSGYVKSLFLSNPGGDTRLVFRAAHELGQAIADISGLPIYYNFAPKHPLMRKWAKKFGNKIFDWENKADLDTEDGTGVYQIVYYPKEQDSLNHE